MGANQARFFSTHFTLKFYLNNGKWLNALAKFWLNTNVSGSINIKIIINWKLFKIICCMHQIFLGNSLDSYLDVQSDILWWFRKLLATRFRLFSAKRVSVRALLPSWRRYFPRRRRLSRLTTFEVAATPFVVGGFRDKSLERRRKRRKATDCEECSPELGLDKTRATCRPGK